MHFKRDRDDAWLATPAGALVSIRPARCECATIGAYDLHILRYRGLQYEMDPGADMIAGVVVLPTGPKGSRNALENAKWIANQLYAAWVSSPDGRRFLAEWWPVAVDT